jgi:hypothetical protein
VFEIRDGFLFQLRDGQKPLRLSTAFEIVDVVSDEREMLFGLRLQAINSDGEAVTFVLEARDFLAFTLTRVEQSFAWHGLTVDNLRGLVRFLVLKIPGTSPTVVTSMQIHEEDDFNDSSNRKFGVLHRAAKRALEAVAVLSELR